MGALNSLDGEDVGLSQDIFIALLIFILKTLRYLSGRMAAVRHSARRKQTIEERTLFRNLL